MPEENQLISFHKYMQKYIDIELCSAELTDCIQRIACNHFDFDLFYPVAPVNVQSIIRWALYNKHTSFILKECKIVNTVSSESTTYLLYSEKALSCVLEYTNWVQYDLSHMPKPLIDTTHNINGLVHFLVRIKTQKLKNIRCGNMHSGSHMNLMTYTLEDTIKKSFIDYRTILLLLEILTEEGRICELAD